MIDSDERAVVETLSRAHGEPALSWTPTRDLTSAALRASARRRRRVGSLALVGLVLAAGGLSFGAARYLGGKETPSSSLRTADGSSGAPSVDFTVGYLPAGYSYQRQEPPEPANVFISVARVYGNANDSFIVQAQYGRVTSLAVYQQLSGALKPVKVNGHAGLIGWNTGHPGDGLHLLYVVRDSHTAFEIAEQPARPGLATLSDAELERVAASVSVSTSGVAPNNAVVPSVIDETQQNAIAELKNAGLVLGKVTYQRTAAVAAGHVVSQSPDAGASVASGAPVDVVIASP